MQGKKSRSAIKKSRSVHGISSALARQMGKISFDPLLQDFASGRECCALVEMTLRRAKANVIARSNAVPATEDNDFHGCQSLATTVRRKIDKMSDINFLRDRRLSYPRLSAHLTMLRGGRCTT
jgi:hypothetical protein